MLSKGTIRAFPLRGRRSLSILGLALVFGLGSPAVASADAPLETIVAIEIHGSAFSVQPERSLLNLTFGGALRVGLQSERFGGHLLFEHNAWIHTEPEFEVRAGVFDIGAGGDIYWGDDLLRSSLTLGISILAQDTVFHRRNSLGFFVDLRPAVFQWALSENVRVELTPFHAVLVAPVLERPTFIQLQVRTSIGLEVRLGR